MSTERYVTALAVVCLSFVCAAADETYFQQYLRIVDTTPRVRGDWPTGLKSPFLVDTNNTAEKLKNVVIPVANLRTNGEIGGIRLGMTTDEVVARWGKPISIACSGPAGPWFAFSDVRLTFETNSLDRIQFRESTRFDHGLRGDSRMEDWLRALGQPTQRTDSSLVYETRGVTRTVFVLRFDSDGDTTFPPALWNNPDWFKAAKP